MALDYNILTGMRSFKPSSVREGIEQGIKDYRLAGLSQVMNKQYSDDPAMQAYSAIDPVDALKMSRDRRKLFSHEAKALSAATPEAEQLRNLIKDKMAEAAQAQVDDPKVNLVPYLNQINNAIFDYNALTGLNVPTVTGQTIKGLTQQRKFTEEEESEDYESVMKILDNTLNAVSNDIKQFASGAPELKKAIMLLESSTVQTVDEMQQEYNTISRKINPESPVQATPEERKRLNELRKLIDAGRPVPKDISPNAVNSAVKIYVKALDDSAVMQGEIAQIAGASLVQKALGWINGVFTGSSMSAKEINQLWDSLMAVAKAHNEALVNLGKGATAEAAQRSEIGSMLGRDINPDIQQKINNIIKSRLDKYAVNIPSIRPDFTDVEFFKQGGGGGGKPRANPLADVEF